MSVVRENPDRLDAMVQRAWREAHGNGAAAVALLRAWTGLGLRDAANAIDRAGLVEIVRFDDKPPHAS
jgi:hypothetical protein